MTTETNSTAAAVTPEMFASMMREIEAMKARNSALEAANADLAELRKAQELQKRRESEGWLLTSEGWIDDRGRRAENHFRIIAEAPGVQKNKGKADVPVLWPAKVSWTGKGMHKLSKPLEFTSSWGAALLEAIDSGELREIAVELMEAHEGFSERRELFAKAKAGEGVVRG